MTDTATRYRVGDRVRVMSLPRLLPGMTKPTVKVGQTVTVEAVAADGQVQVEPKGRFYHPSRLERA